MKNIETNALAIISIAPFNELNERGLPIAGTPIFRQRWNDTMADIATVEKLGDLDVLNIYCFFNSIDKESFRSTNEKANELREHYENITNKKHDIFAKVYIIGFDWVNSDINLIIHEQTRNLSVFFCHLRYDGFFFQQIK